MKCPYSGSFLFDHKEKQRLGVKSSGRVAQRLRLELAAVVASLRRGAAYASYLTGARRSGSGRTVATVIAAASLG